MAISYSVLFGFLLLFLLGCKLKLEMQDNYENQEEDEDVLRLVEKVRRIDPKVDAIVDQLKFFEPYYRCRSPQLRNFVFDF
jgi:hypothetical protein